MRLVCQVAVELGSWQYSVDSEVEAEGYELRASQCPTDPMCSRT